MSVSSIGSTNPLSYLQSLLAQGSSSSPAAAAVSDPLLALFNDFTGGSPPGGAGASAPPLSGSSTPQLSASTLATLFSVQGQQSGAGGASQSVFAKFDANSDGQVSQAEFENAIGPNADKAKVDALFSKIDSNGDGQISQDELSAAAQKAQGHHHHHHAQGGGEAKSGSSGQGGLKDLLSSTDAAGATSQTEAGADGSTTTTVTYADGSKVTMTIPAAGSTGPQQPGNKNLIEQLIKLQSQLLTPSAGGTLATA